MASFTGTFSAAGNASNAVLLKPGQAVTYTTTESAPGTYVIAFQESQTPTSGWTTVTNHTADASVTHYNNSTIEKYYRLNTTSIAVVTIDYTIADASSETQATITNPQSGLDEIIFTDQGVTIARNLSVTGNQTITGTQTYTGASTFTGAVSVNDAASFSIKNIAAPTKIARFSAASITAGQTRTVTVPDSSGTIAYLAGSTFTTATLTDPTINAGGGTIVLPAAASPSQTAEGSIVWDSDDDLLTVGDGAGRKTMVDVGSTQSITGVKTMTTPVLTNPVVNAGSGTVVVPINATPAQTANGSVVWDSDDFLLTVGDGTGRKVMVDTTTAQTLAGPKTLTSPVINTPASINRTAQVYFVTAPGNAKVGTTAGWVVAAANNTSRVTLPAGVTGGTLVLPIVAALKVGWTITGYYLVGQIESAGNAATLDADLFKLTAAAADLTDESIGAITQISVTADTAVTSANSTKTLASPEVIAADESFYVLITGTTAASTDIDLMGVAIIVTEV